MGNVQKRRPFYRVFIGIIFALLTAGGVISAVGSISAPEAFPSSPLQYLLFSGLFLLGAISFLTPVKVEGRKNPSKTKMIILRIAVFFVVWLVLAFAGAFIFQPEYTASGIPISNPNSTWMSLLGMILGIVAAYFHPVPKRWRDAPQEVERKESIPLTETKESTPDTAVDAIEKPKKSIIYEKEDIDL